MEGLCLVLLPGAAVPGGRCWGRCCKGSRDPLAEAGIRKAPESKAQSPCQYGCAQRMRDSSQGREVPQDALSQICPVAADMEGQQQQGYGPQEFMPGLQEEPSDAELSGTQDTGDDHGKPDKEEQHIPPVPPTLFPPAESCQPFPVQPDMPKGKAEKHQPAPHMVVHGDEMALEEGGDENK